MQKQKQPGADPFVEQDQELLKTKPLSIAVPDVHESMRLAGMSDVKLGPKDKPRRLLCCCGEPGCQIGPMMQTEEAPE